MRRIELVTVAVLLAAIDLAQEATEPVYGHPRGLAYTLLAAAIVGGLVAFVPRLGSRALALAGGVAAAGALGNGVSSLAWRGGVPNPIVAGDVAFNVADVCAATGALMLVGGALVFAVANRDRLREAI